MPYALERWERMISTTLTPEEIKGMTQTSVTNLIEKSAQLKETVRTQVMAQVLAASEARSTEIFIQHHQAVLIGLLDKLHVAYEQHPSKPMVKLCEAISKQLEEILSLIEHYFRQYFNLDEKVPLPYLIRAKAEVSSQIPQYKKMLAQRSEIDERLAGIVLATLGAFANSDYPEFTYRGMMYYKELLKELDKIGQLRREDCAYSALKELLIYMNFNTPAFINYFLTAIKDELKPILNNDQKIETLAKHKKEIGQMHVKPNVALHQENSSAQAMLVSTLIKEIEYYNDITPGSVLTEIPSPEVRGFVHMPFKGAEIYLLYKAFIDAGGAPGETYKSLFEKTAPFISNKMQKGFSPESLGKYSDKVTVDVKENVRRFLQKMIRNVESYD